jgi:hypothetical protein
MNLPRNLHALWLDPSAPKRFRTGVSLHGHTLHSQESLGFIPQHCSNWPFLGDRIRRNAGQFTRSWWTPPLGPMQAWRLERHQVEELGLEALVSLTDHDNIEAGRHLRVLEEGKHIPIGVEWTVPWAGTFFHIGIHNIPMAISHEWMSRMEAITADPQEDRIIEALADMDRVHQVLIVLNHPLWDETGVGVPNHRFALGRLLGRCGGFFHAMELNGLRPWSENARVVDLAQTTRYPLISGGDRHAREPNACLNLSHAATFDEFVNEIREGESQVLFMPQYQENFRWRILHNMADVMSVHPDHAQGWKQWSDRVFYQWEDGRVQSLTELWCSPESKDRVPFAVHCFSRLMSVARHPRLRARASLSSQTAFTK